MKKELEMDAFAHGQVASKLWLLEELEKISTQSHPVVWILGGWYGLLNFLMGARDRLRPHLVRSFDIDPEVAPLAETINKHWEIQEGRFRAITFNANELKFSTGEFGPSPHIVVNTSCEHFESLQWFENIPSGTLVALQSTDMPHEQHTSGVLSLEEMRIKYAALNLLFSDEKEFRFPSWSFRRFMLIGVKK